MKKLTFLLVIAVALFSCEAESFNESVTNQESNPTENTPTDVTDEVIDTFDDTSKGLNN